MKKTRVLVAEDSATIRKYLVDVLAKSEGFEVVGEAENGKQAIELCEATHPDVITMDIVMPVMSGLSATEYIMAYCPTPILIVSASMNRRESMQTYDALGAGAVDVLEKETLSADPAAWEAKLTSALRVASRVKVITRSRPRARTNGAREMGESLRPSTSDRKINSNSQIDLIAIGASTGGPAAVAEVLRSLPPTFRIPLVLVIHISSLFARSLVDWLNTISPIPVAFATDGATIPPVGTPAVIFAPADKHLVVKNGRLALHSGSERNYCRPSVDVLFESVGAELGPRAALCLLTGMGRDGAFGLLAAKQAGSITIAQDEGSSTVFGMPGEAVKLGAADYVLPLNQISPFLQELANSNAPRFQRA